MKLRRLFTLCLLAVYLLSVGGAAWAALTCPCVARRAHEKRHVCNIECVQRHDDRAHVTSFSADCCGSHLNDAAGLYTAASGQEKQLRRAVTAPEMQSALPAAVAVTLDEPLAAERHWERPLLFRSDPPVLHAGLRAPPVVA